MLRGIYGDPERYRETYWSRFEGRYFAGDGAKLDDDGYLWLLGRVDDVMNVSGHRVSTTEVESALVDHPAVAEAAVVGANDDDHRPGDHRLRDPEGRRGADPRHGEELRAARRRQDRRRSPGRRPIIFTDDLPKTAVGQDHAPAAPRRRRGPRPRRHDHAGRPRRRRGDQAPGYGQRRPRSDARRPTWEPDDNWRLADRRPSSPGRRSCSTSTACCPTPPAASTSSRAGPAGLGRLLRGVRRRPADRGGGPPARTCSTRRSGSSCSPAGRCGCSPRPSPGWSRYELRWDLLIMRTYGDYSAARRLQAADSGASSRHGGLELRLAFEDDRRNLEMFRAEGVPCVYIHSRLLRLSERNGPMSNGTPSRPMCSWPLSAAC